MVAMGELYPWQRRVVDRVLDSGDTAPLFVVAESNMGKTTALAAAEAAADRAVRRDGFELEAGEQTLASAYEGPVDVVLVDEAGRLTDPWSVAECIRAHGDVQTVLATLPACPPVELLAAALPATTIRP